MEVHTHHRSRSRAAAGATRPPPAPPASFSSKKPYSNGNGFTAYDDVFGGPPKFGATAPPFAPRAEDYMEIFGSFLSSRASSIPILDLPPVDDSVAAFDIAGAGCDYSDVFGGLEFSDFAVSYDELFRRSDGGEDSSDGAWTPTGSEGSDPPTNSERNRCFVNPEFNQPVESQQFNVSYHQVNSGTMEDSSCTRVAQCSAVPGYSYMVRGSTSLEHEGRDRCSSVVTDDIILREDPSGNTSLETFCRSSPDRSHDFSGKQLYEPHQRSGTVDVGSNSYFLDPTAAPVSDVEFSSKASESREQSRPPPHNLFGSFEASSDFGHRGGAYDKNADSDSLPFFYADVVVSPSDLASIEAMKEAMQRAELKLKRAKESMERKKDGRNGANNKPSLKINKISEGVKATVACDELAAIKREKSDLRQSKPHSAHKEIRNQVNGISETGHPSHDIFRAVPEYSAPVKPSQNNVTEDHSPSTDSGSVGEDEWKEASQYFELLDNDNFKTEQELLDSSNRVEHELNSHHFVKVMGKHMAVEHEDRDDSVVVGSSSSSLEGGGGDDEGSNHSEEDQVEQIENRPRLRAVKAAVSRQDFHQKMVKVAQEFHESVNTNHLDVENKVKKGWQGDASDGKTDICVQANEQTDEGTAEKLGLHRKYEEAPSKVRTTTKSKEVKLTEYMEEGKKVFKGGQKESGMTEAYTTKREENGKSIKACPAVNKNRKAGKEADQSDVSMDHHPPPKEKRRKEKACPSDESDTEDKITIELKVENSAKSGKRQLQQRCRNLEEADSNSREMDKGVSAGRFMTQPRDTFGMKQSENIIIEDTVTSHCYETVKDSIEQEGVKEHEVPLEFDLTAESKIADVAQKSVMNNLESPTFVEESMSSINSSELKKTRKVRGNGEQKTEQQEGCINHVKLDSKSDDDVQVPRKVSGNADHNMEQQVGCRDQALNDLQSDVGEPVNLPGAKVHVESENFTSTNELPSPTNSGNAKFSQMACSGSEEPGSSNSSTLDVSGKSDFKVSPECDGQGSSDAAQKTHENEDSNGDCNTRPLVVEDELKAAGTADTPLSADNMEKKKVVRPVMPERKESIQNRSQPTTAIQRFGQEKPATNGNLKGEERGRAERLKSQKELEEEDRLRKLEEEMEREREREKDRMAVELGKVEKAAVDQASAEARKRSMAEARERLEKACAEARGKSLSDKSSSAEAARLKAERAAVERATAEVRERALEKAKVERFGRSVSDNITGTRFSSLSSDVDGGEGESAERSKAKLERHRRTVERVAKALAEKNMRDLIAQREQAERNRFAETLDADIKRWSSGKEGNLRALLSTLQYILGPESGWQPIPLTEVITSAAVKKAYRKATLCVHPDKLQQRGATVQQKYVCEKVFDMLKDGWNKFNSEER